MKFRQSLFWDIDVSKLDPDKNAEYVIERILDFGDDDEVRWMISHYQISLINKVLETSRVVMPFTKALWAWLYPNQLHRWHELKIHGNVKFPPHAKKIYDKWYKTWWLNPDHEMLQLQ